MKKNYHCPEMNVEEFNEDVIALSFGETGGEGGGIGWGDGDIDLNDLAPSGPVGDKYVDPVGSNNIVTPK